MTLPKVETVNAVTMEQGRTFAEEWFGGDGDITDACDITEILKFPETEDADAENSFHNLTKDICRRVYEAMKAQIAETFVRIANAVIEEERVRPEEPLMPPRVETAEVVTREHGLVFAEDMHRQTIDSEDFSVAFSKTRLMTFPDGGDDAAEKHFHEMTNEIRDRLYEETKQRIADAFVRVVSDVISRERRR